jgi:hypothetical protein
MNRIQISKALAIAQSSEDLSDVDDSTLIGYGLPDFTTTYVTLRQVAKMLRWQCFYFTGEINAEEFDQFCKLAKNRILIIENA